MRKLVKPRLVALALLAVWAAPAFAAVGVGTHLSLAHGDAAPWDHLSEHAAAHVHSAAHAHGSDHNHGGDPGATDDRDHRAAVSALARALEHGHVHAPADSGEEPMPEHDHEAAWTRSVRSGAPGAQPAFASLPAVPRAAVVASSRRATVRRRPGPPPAPIFQTSCALLL